MNYGQPLLGGHLCIHARLTPGIRHGSIGAPLVSRRPNHQSPSHTQPRHPHPERPIPSSHRGRPPRVHAAGSCALAHWRVADGHRHPLARPRGCPVCVAIPHSTAPPLPLQSGRHRRCCYHCFCRCNSLRGGPLGCAVQPPRRPSLDLLPPMPPPAQSPGHVSCFLPSRSASTCLPLRLRTKTR